MKTIFRLAMVMALLFIWGGVAQPEELVLQGTDHEYLVAMETGTLPSTPIEPFVLKEATEVAAPGFDTWEYRAAMETGNLPSACAGEFCGQEEISIVEVGGISYRVPIDVGP